MAGPLNLSQVCLSARARGLSDRTAVAFLDGEGRSVARSYGAVEEAALKLAAGLSAAGLAPGDRVTLRVGNEWDFVTAFFAAVAAGGVASPISSLLTVEEARALVEDADSSFVILGAAHAFEHEAYRPRRVLLHGDLEALAANAQPAAYAATRDEDAALLVYTSGTSSRPKGVLHAQRVVLGRAPMRREWLDLRPGDRLLHAGALNWTYGLGVGLLDPLAVGATALVYAGKRDPAIWPSLIESARATHFAATPSIYRQMLKYGDPTPEALNSLRVAASAGEALSPALLDEWRERTGRDLVEAYGMSEISTFVSNRPGKPIAPGSPGRPQTGRRVAILPQDAGEAPAKLGETGVIAVHRSESGLMLGYWRRPDEEAAAWRGDWFLTGDLAAEDQDGRYWLKGRSDDLMNAFGYRVSPLEVEAAYADCPGVAEIAVLETRPREDVGVITAFVVPRQGAQLNEADLLAHVERRLALYKRPRRVVFVTHLPRNPNGKLNRKALAG